MYIHELPNWPDFQWEQERIMGLLLQIRHQQGRLTGGMESIGFQLCEKAILNTITKDVVKSSEIEGEILDESLVCSSVARHLGIETAALGATDRNIEGVVEMMLDATQKYDQPLTKEMILHWHSLLFPLGLSGYSKIKVGRWRPGIVQVVSGRMGKEIVHFEAPSAVYVEKEMEVFLDWLNTDERLDLVLKAAIAHLWFLTIHPFEDGNGRIGRAIVDMLLSRSENSPRRFYSLSSQIQIQRKSYYAILEKTQKGTLNITDWIEWFLNCINGAIEDAFTTPTITLQKSHFWDSLKETTLNERQRKVINQLLDDFVGKLTSSKWAKMAKCSQDTAYRDIMDLVDRGILSKNPESGRSTSYNLNY